MRRFQLRYVKLVSYSLISTLLFFTTVPRAQGQLLNLNQLLSNTTQLVKVSEDLSSLRLSPTSTRVNLIVQLNGPLSLTLKTLIGIIGGGRITVADTLVFLILMLYGGEAAVAVAALEGAASILRISRKLSTMLFNASVMAVSLLTSVMFVRLFFGYLIETKPHFTTGRLVAALAVLALAHYFVNSGLVSIDRSLKTGSPMLTTWTQYYLWTSLTYFAGALAAGTLGALNS